MIRVYLKFSVTPYLGVGVKPQIMPNSTLIYPNNMCISVFINFLKFTLVGGGEGGGSYGWDTLYKYSTSILSTQKWQRTDEHVFSVTS